MRATRLCLDYIVQGRSTRTQKNSEYVVYIEVVQLQVKTLGSGMG